MSEQKRKRRPRRSYDAELRQDRSIVVGTLDVIAALEQRYPEVGEFVVCRKMLRDAADLFTTMIADANREPVEEQPPAPRRSTPEATEAPVPPIAVPPVQPAVVPTPPFAPVDVTLGIDDGF